MTATQQLQQWFDSLPRGQQEEVVNFLYGGRMLLKEGRYLGPPPGVVVKGLHCGPAPASTGASGSFCPRCGRPW